MGCFSDCVCESSHTSIRPPSTLYRFTNYHCFLFCFVLFCFLFVHTQAHKHDRKFSAPSSETQGQIVGGGKVGIGKKKWAKKSQGQNEKSGSGTAKALSTFFRCSVFSRSDSGRETFI